VLVLFHAAAVAVVVAEAGGGIVAHRKKMSSFGIIKSSFEACQRPIVADFSSFRNNIKCILLLFTYSGAAPPSLPPLHCHCCRAAMYSLSLECSPTQFVHSGGFFRSF
jgi:hypothetical protein